MSRVSCTATTRSQLTVKLHEAPSPGTVDMTGAAHTSRSCSKLPRHTPRAPMPRARPFMGENKLLTIRKHIPNRSNPLPQLKLLLTNATLLGLIVTPLCDSMVRPRLESYIQFWSPHLRKRWQRFSKGQLR